VLRCAFASFNTLSLESQHFCLPGAPGSDAFVMQDRPTKQKNGSFYTTVFMHTFYEKL